MEMHIGFTGTQQEPTEEQKITLKELLIMWYDMCEGDIILHEGDCIGADAVAFDFSKEIGYKTYSHPPTNPSKRAFREATYTSPKFSYLKRNQDIVNVSQLLIAVPKSYEEEIQSGTWYTVRRARKKNIQIIIILPDGSIRDERIS